MCAGESEGKVEIIGYTVKESNETTGNTSERAGEAIANPHLQSPNVEIIEIAVQRCIALQKAKEHASAPSSTVTLPRKTTYILGLQMLVVMLLEPLTEEIPDVSKDYQHEI